MLPAISIERILSFGGGVRIDGSQYPAVSLERFATFAAGSGASLMIYNCKTLPAISMERIAAFGKGRVIFEIDVTE